MWRRAVGVVALVIAAAGCSNPAIDAAPPASDASATAPTTAPASGGTTPTPGGSTPAGSVPAAGGGGTTARGGAPVARFAGFSDPTYAKGENWLCGPHIATKDRCLTDNLDTTVLKADGTTEVKHTEPAANPGFDCFYVYPTVNFSTAVGNDDAMAGDTSQEEPVIHMQAARLREQCRVYAPLYRQLTFGPGGDPAKAYSDVHNAFKQYMATWNSGRPVLLIGHSQGAGMLLTLLREEFDDDPELRGRLVSAILMGGMAQEALDPANADKASLHNIPPCSDAAQNGCVIGFNSLSKDASDANRAQWGKGGEGTKRLCRNPGALGGGAAPVTPIVAADPTAVWLTGKPVGEPLVTTPFVELPDAVTAECVTRDSATYLQLTPTAAPGDQRNMEGLMKADLRFWGLHIQEAQLMMRTLIDLVKTQGANAH